MPAKQLSFGSIRRWTLFAAALVTIVSCTAPFRDDDVRVKKEKERKATPDFALKDSTGALVKLSDYKGKVVLLNFWATWCGPCKIEIPWFTDFQKTYKDRDFAVIGVSMDEDGWDSVKPYVDQHKMNYRVVVGNDEVSQLFGSIDSLPTTLIIDREGRIASMHIGLVAKNTYQKEIEQLLEASKDAPKTGAVRPAGSEFAFVRAK
ncbi:MAG TPA: TlpA disulfide reductase family protein [Bryobacteraceae bacterium]|jgi:peroxiredoxin